MDEVQKFNEFREKVNKVILEKGTLNTKRFFNLDQSVYDEGHLSKKTKEFIGLAASIVLRCDDCIKYHILQLKELGAKYEEFFEAFDVALIVGGSITIPHLRRAVVFLEEIEKDREEENEKK
ncbi:MAG: carboxymuconolactone decarboxylase family protein [Acidobacteria bacterium]|nr:carboxymuconolactone decarboxylase family protein [Acidobacteriota bacterium]